MDGTIRLLKKHYWGNILLLLLLFLLVILGVLPLFDGIKTVNLTVEMYDIVIAIIAIPLSLKYFGDKMKKAARPLEVETAIRVYKGASYWRMYTLSTITLGQVVLYGLSGNMNFFWLTVVLLIVFLFCKPSYVELATMTQRTNEEGTKEDDKRASHYYEEDTNAYEEDAEEEKGDGDEQAT